MPSSSRFSLTPTQRGELQVHLKSRNLPLSMALRMRIILMLDEGASYNDIKEKLDTTAPTISLWKRRYRQAGVVGLVSVHPGQPPKKLTPQFRAKVLAKTQQHRRTALRIGRCAKWRWSWE
jgi:transposase